MMTSFAADLAFSMGEREKVDCEMIRMAIPNCEIVYKTDKKTDKLGIDYIAVLRDGATINIDAKRRRKGVRMIDGYPELALEIWSVVPDEDNQGKVGWTRSLSTNVDMILYVFDKSDWDKFYIVPFQHLRMAFEHNMLKWEKMYGVRVQENATWYSSCMFVPANVVLRAVACQMAHTIEEAG